MHMLRLLLTATLCCCTAAASAVPPSALDLPQIGEPADNTLTPMQEKQLGSRVMAQLYQAGYILEDPELSTYISTLGWKLASHSKTQAPELTFFVVNDPRVNAFAMPGGFVGFNAGLLLAADNESEVAGVMGHELAHVTQRHIARTAEDTEVATIATWLAVLAAIIAGSADPDVVIGALSAGQALNYQRQVGYTRAHEQEADRIGIQTMAAAGFDPEGMAAFFQKLGQQARLYGTGLPEILRTHPLSTNRVAEARTRAEEMPPVHPEPSLEFELMRARARVLTIDRPTQAVDYFGRQISGGRDSAANRYGMALALNAQAKVGDALDALAPAARQYPQQANIQLLDGQLHMEAGKVQAGLEILERTLQRYPRYAPAILGYAEGLMNAGQPEQARQLLISREPALGTQFKTHKLLAEAARETGNLAEASFQMANFLYLRGEAGQALAQLDAGLRIPDIDPQERARLVAKRKEIRGSLPDQWRPAQPGRMAGLRSSADAATWPDHNPLPND